MDKGKACAFTGHRPAHFHFKYDEQHPDCVKLKEQMRMKMLVLIKRGVTTFLSGMALGVDIWATEIVLELKEQNPALKLVSVLPCETQANRWSVEQRERYFNLLARCDDEIYVSRDYTSSCMFKRNRYLVDHADYLLAVYDGGDRGGTAYTVGYARQKGREIVVVPAEGNKGVIDIEEVRIRE